MFGLRYEGNTGNVTLVGRTYIVNVYFTTSSPQRLVSGTIIHINVTARIDGGNREGVFTIIEGV